MDVSSDPQASDVYITPMHTTAASAKPPCYLLWVHSCPFPSASLVGAPLKKAQISCLLSRDVTTSGDGFVAILQPTCWPILLFSP